MPVSAEQQTLYVNRLAECARNGNELAFAQLARALGPLIGYEAQRIYVPGAEHEDVRQEALLALHAAVLSYDGERPFVAFARFVIRRQLATMLKTALRRKHQPLSMSRRLEQPGRDGVALGEVVADRSLGPHERAELREELGQLTAAASRLSEFERHALGGFLSGIPYTQLGDDVKSVDNAIQRARRRLRRACA
jgi:RNA polymerase sporulation-specific sigma factor